MHTLETRNAFLKLRVEGWSFARISAHLGVSKPTLIDWSRRREVEIQSLKRSETDRCDQDLRTSSDAEAARLSTCLNALRQELLSREVRSIATGQLESLATDLQRQLDTLEAVKKTHLPAPNGLLFGKAGKGW